jgi:hypothetical protein
VEWNRKMLPHTWEVHKFEINHYRLVLGGILQNLFGVHPALLVVRRIYFHAMSLFKEIMPIHED